MLDFNVCCLLFSRTMLSKSLGLWWNKVKWVLLFQNAILALMDKGIWRLCVICMIDELTYTKYNPHQRNNKAIYLFFYFRDIKCRILPCTFIVIESFNRFSISLGQGTNLKLKMEILLSFDERRSRLKVKKMRQVIIIYIINK